MAPLRAPMDINAPGGSWLKERKLPSQSPSVTVSFFVHNNLKITSVSYLFYILQYLLFSPYHP